MNTTGLIFIFYTRLKGTTRGGTWKQTFFEGETLGGSLCLTLACFITWSRPFGWIFSFFFS